MLSVALSVDVNTHRPGVTWQRALLEPGLSSRKTTRDHPTDSIRTEDNQNAGFQGDFGKVRSRVLMRYMLVD